MKKLFVSYNHGDLDFVRKLTRDLEVHGAEVWQDEREIRIGESVINKIREAIDRSDYFVVVLSQRSLNSRWYTLERSPESIAERVQSKWLCLVPLVANLEKSVRFSIAKNNRVNRRNLYLFGPCCV